MPTRIQTKTFKISGKIIKDNGVVLEILKDTPELLCPNGTKVVIQELPPPTEVPTKEEFCSCEVPSCFPNCICSRCHKTFSIDRIKPLPPPKPKSVMDELSCNVICDLVIEQVKLLKSLKAKEEK